MPERYYYVVERKSYANLDEALERAKEIDGLVRECATCAEIAKSGFGPSHNGSPSCECGSIASGGRNTHCTCDTCF